MQVNEQEIAELDANRLWEEMPIFDWRDLGFNKLVSLIMGELATNLSFRYQYFFLHRLSTTISQSYENHLTECTAYPSAGCPENQFYSKAKYFVDEEIKKLNPNYDRGDLNSDLINRNLLQLQDFPKAAESFQEALSIFDEGKYDRMVKDTLRLSLELFLKEKLKNSKPLEKQGEEIGKLLKGTGTSKEINNMFLTLINYYGDYQNANIKHDDNAKRDEVQLIINLTGTFIEFLVNK